MTDNRKFNTAKPTKDGQITRERLMEVFDYDPAEGVFRWKKARLPTLVGKKSGSLSKGYVQIAVDSKVFQAHRLAWLWVHGVWPSKFIDHINGDKADNRIDNLREATTSQNMMNRPKSPRNTSGHKGVHWSSDRDKWTAVIKLPDKRLKRVGDFDTVEEAAEARRAAEEQYYGEFARKA